MNFDACIAKYNGQVLNNYGGECVALVANYCADNGKPIAWANAKDWWGNPSVAGAFDFITNNPSDLHQVPTRGAIVVWDGNLAGSGGYGHIAIFDAVVSPGVFRSLDNNWGGRYVHFVNHNWNNIIGWMVPKGATPPAPTQGGDEMISTADQASKIYKMLRPNGGASQGEIDGTAGKRSFAGFLNDAQAEIAARDEGLRNQSAQLGTMQGTINQLNQAVTSITQARDKAIADGSKTKEDLVKMMADEQPQLAHIAQLTADLETAHDTITDLQAVKPVDEKVVVQNWFIKIWNSLFKKG